MKTLSRFVAIGMAILSFFHGLGLAQGNQDSSEQILFRSANRERMARGLRPLAWGASLAEAARQHALLLAQQNALSHQFPGEASLAERAARAGARFNTIAENIAEGPNAEGLHQQWMKSPPHRANLLDPQLNSAGVAVVERNGVLFAVEDFSETAENLSLREQESVVEGQLRSRGLHVLDYRDEARRTCAMDNGYAGNHRPSFVVHYANANLNSLPEMLEERIKSRRYHSGVVGACPLDKKRGFSLYRVAVMLYE
jgi:uncharacterized protein YkwD